MPTVLLTNAFISTKLICPPEKDHIEYCDEQFPGLYVEVRSSSPGRGTYRYRYKDSGKTTRHQKVGRTEDISLSEARVRAKELKAKIALGADPWAEAKAQKAVPTLADFFRDSYLPYAKQQKRSWQRDEVLFRLRVAPNFGHLRLNEIKRQAVQNFLGTIVDKEGLAKATADHHVKLLRQMLNRAVDWEVIPINPIARIKLFNADNRKENYLEGDQLTKLLEVLRTDGNRGVCNAALFLLCTGARLNEALSATWDHIDRENRVWRIPALNSKSKKVRSVPLNDAAIDLLDQLGGGERGERLFVSEKTGEPLRYVHKVWERIRKKAGLPELRLHDLRHQFASFLVNSGRTLYEVQKILGHSNHAVTERYAHLSSTTLMDAANSASVMIRGAQQKVGVAAGEA
jgi:integrase